MSIPKIVPIAELRDTKHVLEMCRQVDEPIIVTKNGYGELVIMSINAYSKLNDELNRLKRLVSQDQ